MGRPLNKKYFGNTNTPAIGGEGVASVTVGGTNNAYTALATATIGAPDLPGGIQAVLGAIAMKVASVAINNPGAKYTVGDIVTLGGGGVVNDTTAGTFTSQVRVRIDSVDAPETGVVTGVSIVNGTAGSYTVLPAKVAGGSNSTNLSAESVTVADPTANNLRLDVTYSILSVAVTTAGSGYSTAPVITEAGNADLTAVLSAVKQNAIAMTAFLTGGSAVAVDIIRQVSTRRYKVTDGTRTGIVQLQDSLANAAGEASIVAVDSAGGTYYITKLTAHKATLVRGTGTEFATGAAVKWTLGAAVLNNSVQIANA